MTSRGLWRMLELGLDVRIALVGHEHGAGFTSIHQIEDARQVELTLLRPNEDEAVAA